MNSYIQTRSKGWHVGIVMLLSVVLLLAVMLLTMPTVHAAEEDVETWTASGTCEWGIDPDGCLWIRPADGVSGTLAYSGTGNNLVGFNVPWKDQRASINSVVVKAGVSVSTCMGMFDRMSNCTSMDLSGLNTSSVTSMSYMFYGCSALTSLDVSGLDTSNVTNMYYMFSGCSSLTSLNVSGLNTGNVKYMDGMFHGCSSLTRLDVSGFDTSNVTNMSGMFRYCNFESIGPGSNYALNIANFNTANVTNMAEMFSGCWHAKTINLSHFNTSSVTDFSQMLYMWESGYDFVNDEQINRPARLEYLDISSFDTRNATKMDEMLVFQGPGTGRTGNIALRRIVIGPNFYFNGNGSVTNKPIFPTPPSADMIENEMRFYSGKWVLDGDSSGSNAMTPSEMRDVGHVTPGEYVWEPENTYAYIYYSNSEETITPPDYYENRNSYKKTDVTGAGSAINTTYNKYGKTHTGWNTEPDGSGSHIDLGGTIPSGIMQPGKMYVLYAEYEAQPIYTIVYNNNESHYGFGQDSITEKQWPVGEISRVERSALYNSQGYELVKWNTMQDGTGEEYVFDQAIQKNTFVEGDVLNLYGVWEEGQNISAFAVLIVDQNDNVIDVATVIPFGNEYDAETGESYFSYQVSPEDRENIYYCTNPVFDMIYTETDSETGDTRAFFNYEYDPLVGFEWEHVAPTNEIATTASNEYNDYRIYKIVRGNTSTELTDATEFDATLLIDQNASIPNVEIAFTAAPGTGMAAVPGTSLEVLAPTAENGVNGTPTIGAAVFAADDTTVAEVDGVTIDANQKAVVKPVSIDFNGVAFAQPGVFRYLIAEPSTGSGLTYDTQLGDAENGVRYQRVLDVYVQRVDDANTGTTSYQIAGYVFHEVENAPAVGATAAADKSSGFVHEYDTKTVTLESRAAGNQSSIDKYFAYTITVQNPNNSVFTVSADWTNAADALNPTANPATKYDTATITAANTAAWTSNEDGSLSKTIYLCNGQKVELDGIPAGATYSVTVADEDYSPSWTAGDGSGSNNTTGNRVLNAMEDVVFTLTREGVVPTGVMLSAVPGLIIMAGALIAVVAMRKRKEGADA